MRNPFSKYELVVRRRFTPCRSCVFTLTLYDTHEQRADGRTTMAYRLFSDGVPIFQGIGYTPAPTVCIDSDEAVLDLMSFLCVEQSDGVGEDFFKDYTLEQKAFRDHYAADLWRHIEARYGRGEE